MAIGYESTLGVQNLNSMLGTNATGLRNIAADIEKLWSAIDSLGSDEAAQIAALQSLGFSAEDAASYWAAANQLHAVAGVYYGQQAQPSAFDFDDALAAVRAGQ